ncbi:HK97 gp10 family phage protein [Mesorhizobium sp. YIM 152430]|nr:HK97 gp10 family phage protein [Mesorhizobium sp. YIM 152430]
MFRASAQFVIEDVRARTPRDTGYLVNSLTTSLDGPLPMRGTQGDGYTAPPFIAVIAGADLGDVITASFVAEYAAAIEYGARGREGRGMVRLAAQNWQAHVDRATAEAKAAVRSRG